MANVKFRDFLLSDLILLEPQDIHIAPKEAVLSSAIIMAGTGRPDFEGFTMVEDGKVVACCGIVNNEVWAFLGKDLRRSMVALTRHSIAFCNRHAPCRASIDETHENAVRWIKALGFKPLGHGYWQHE